MFKLVGIALLVLALGLVLAAGVSADDGTPPGGTSPDDAVQLTCEAPITGHLDPGQHTWLWFTPFGMGRDLAVILDYSPVTDPFNVANNTGFNVWYDVKLPLGPSFQIIGRGTKFGETLAEKTWRGGADLGATHFIEIAADEALGADYTISMNCAWPNTRGAP